MDAFPKVFCLKSENNNQYLQFKSDCCQTHSFLQFSCGSALDAYTQFQVEKSKSDDSLIHIKCRWNHKYWVRWSHNHQWITGSSWEPQEDQTSWNCTLYKPTILESEDSTGKAKKVRLMHVQLEHYVALKKIEHYPFNDSLLAGSKETDSSDPKPLDIFTVVDCESIYRVPKNVAIKGDNGLYLGASMMDDKKPCLEFKYDDPKDPMVAQEIRLNPDGIACIKSRHYGKFWRSGEQDFIFVDADEDGPNNKDGSVFFRLSVMDIHVIALMNINRVSFVKRNGMDDKENFLCANTQYIDMWARLEIFDLDNN